MAVKTRIEPIDRDIALIFSEELSPHARSKVFAQFAGEQIDEAKQINQRALGRVPDYTVTVDGTAGASLSNVRPDGVIVAEFELQNEALAWIYTQLQKHSPVLTGRYVNSHELFADGAHVENPNNPPLAEEYVFLNIQPYARKIDRAVGVYHAVAALASGKYGNSSKISFTFRSAAGFESLDSWANRTALGSHIRNEPRRGDWLRRQPAIIVRSR